MSNLLTTPLGRSSKREFAGVLPIYMAGGLFWAFLSVFIGLQVASGGLALAAADASGLKPKLILATGSLPVSAVLFLPIASDEDN